MTAAAQASITRAARLAGGRYLTLVPLGVFSFIYVPSVLLVRGDAAATSRHILASPWLFRSATVSHLISYCSRASPRSASSPSSESWCSPWLIP